MKKRRRLAFLALSPALLGLSLFQSACQSLGYYRGQRAPSMASPSRMASVERAWNARFEYDHDRRLLIPKHNGTRWGAVQEFKEDSTIVFREWRVRDVKLEDLEASPATNVVVRRESEEPEFIPDANEFGVAPTEVSPPAASTVLPSIDLPLMEPTVGTGGPELPVVPGNPPGFQLIPEAGSGVAPFQMAPLDALPSGPGTAAPSPFTPLPGALPSVGLPGAPAQGGMNPLPAAPGAPFNPVPGGIPVAPPLGVDPVPPDPGPMVPPAGPAPANPFPAPGAGPAPAGPGPMVPPAGPAPANPFPAVPGGAPGGANPLGPPPAGPAPGNPFPAPGAGPAPVPANPFGPAPAGPDPMVPPAGPAPGNPFPAPDAGPASVPANPFGPAPAGANPEAPVPPGGNPFAPDPANPAAPPPPGGNPFAP